MTKKTVVKKPVGRPRKVMANNDGTADVLTQGLLATFVLLKKGKVDPKVANAMASQSREICRIAKLKLEISKYAGNQGDAVKRITF